MGSHKIAATAAGSGQKVIGFHFSNNYTK